MIYGMLRSKLQEDLVRSIGKGSVEAESESTVEALSCDLREPISRDGAPHQGCMQDLRHAANKLQEDWVAA